MTAAREVTAAVILAGGASSRFGADKLAVDLDGAPLLHHALAAADAVAGTIVVVLAPGAAAPELPELRARVVIAHDLATHQGPLAGLAAGLAALESSITRAVLAGGDMPTLVPAVLEALMTALDADPGLGSVMLEAEPFTPLPMAVRPSLVGPVAGDLLADGRRALRAILDRLPSAVLPADVWRRLDPETRTLRDVDTRRDLFHR